jgi:flagellar basal-body rod protein FlgB
MEINTSDNITDLLQKYLDVQSRRAQVIAGNIANADTPGYSAKELKFDDFLQEAVRESSMPASARGMSGTREPLVVERDGATIGPDGNSVDMGREMAEMAEAGTQFNAGAKMLQARFRLLRTAIREGK